MNCRLHLYFFCILATANAYAASNESAVISVRVGTVGDKVSVKVDLSDSITPTLRFATNPDRLIADFPNVSLSESLRDIPVGKNGVERVLIGLNNTSLPITYVVVTLESPRPVTVETSDRRVVLNILPALEKGPVEQTERSETEKSATSIVAGSSDLSVEASSVLGEVPASGEPHSSAPPRVGPKITGIAETTPREDRPATTESVVAASEPTPSTRAGRLRWILPILTTSVILAMLVIALISHIQNKKVSRGI